jgi:NADH/NAD ratio-sensing transcriptional regulator Rex
MFYVSPGTTPVSVATALAYIGRFPKSKLLVTDTSDNIAKNLDNLQKIANNVTTLTISDLGTPLAITANQLRKNATILGKLGSANYDLHVRDVTAANAASVANNAHVKTITVTDTSSAKNYYLSESGRMQVNAPWETADYYNMVRQPNRDEVFFA